MVNAFLTIHVRCTSQLFSFKHLFSSFLLGKSYLPPKLNPESTPRILLKTVSFALIAFFLLWLLFFCFDCFLVLIAFLLIPLVQHVRILFILLFAQAWTITLRSELTICRLQIANCKISRTEVPSCKTPTGSWKLSAELLHSRIRQQENIRSTKFLPA